MHTVNHLVSEFDTLYYIDLKNLTSVISTSKHLNYQKVSLFNILYLSVL